jgi:hypothetical protein
MAAMEPLCTSIHCHQHKKEGVVDREWTSHTGLMTYMRKNNNQVKRVATSYHRPFKYPTIATKAQKQNQRFRSKRININWSQIKQPTEATNSALQQQVLPNSSGLKCLPWWPLACIVSHPPSKESKRTGVNHLSKMHKIPIGKCAQL